MTLRTLPRLLLLFAALLLLALPVGGTAMAETPSQAPGQRFEIDPGKLPAPYATDAVANVADLVDRPSPPPFRLPPGFSINEFAGGLSDPRWMTVDANGDVFLALPRLGQVLLLRDKNGDGKAELKTVFAAGFQRPHGLAIHEGYLYVAGTDGLWRVKLGGDRATTKPEMVTKPDAFGAGVHHWTRNVVFSPDGKRFFIAIGSVDNIGEDPLPHATVQSFAADGSDQKTFAAGLRNPVGIAFYPGTNDLYTVVNERDGLGDGLVPDYLTRLQEGGFYGWPYAYIGHHVQPDFPSRPEMVAKTLTPDLLFQSHSAPLGLVFYDGKMFPPEYQGDAIVALHGSWNSSEPTGYKVVRVPFKDGRPRGYYENFLTGFWLEGQSPAQVWGRPAGLAVAADGSLLIADDAGGVVWRVSYRKP
ncbi:MAG TPA: sorbosone dehydrogenase family protein [Dongiaceae bacterium]